MTTRAKFIVNTIEISQNRVTRKDEAGKDVIPYAWDPVEMRTVKLSPVYGNGDPNHENTKFWNASPSGSLTLGTINPNAWAMFEIGKEYYIDFTKAE